MKNYTDFSSVGTHGAADRDQEEEHSIPGIAGKIDCCSCHYFRMKWRQMAYY